jgi:hypothetical protein
VHLQLVCYLIIVIFMVRQRVCGLWPCDSCAGVHHFYHLHRLQLQYRLQGLQHTLLLFFLFTMLLIQLLLLLLLYKRLVLLLDLPLKHILAPCFLML